MSAHNVMLWLFSAFYVKHKAINLWSSLYLYIVVLINKTSDYDACKCNVGSSLEANSQNAD